MEEFLTELMSNKDGFNLLAKIAKGSKELSNGSFKLDLSTCSFFEANMAAPLYAILTHYYQGLNIVSIRNIQPKTETILRKNHFLSHFGYSVLDDTHQTTLPFKKFKGTAGEQFSEYLDQYMNGRGIPVMSALLKKKFRQNLFEVFQNAASHAESDLGIFICGQYYPNKNRLDFTIADAGIGIRDNVRRYFNNDKINSCAAIKWAVQGGNSTRKGKQPGGLGLKLIKDFIQLNKGKIQIVSRFGFYEYSPEGEKIEKMDNDFPGTCVNIEINTAVNIIFQQS